MELASAFEWCRSRRATIFFQASQTVVQVPGFEGRGPDLPAAVDDLLIRKYHPETRRDGSRPLR
jgi:hypothetical protein